METQETHSEHWTEPQSMTTARPAEEKYCESCGVEIPYHAANCQLKRSKN